VLVKRYLFTIPEIGVTVKDATGFGDRSLVSYLQEKKISESSTADTATL
jgi:hypothetical protein